MLQIQLLGQFGLWRDGQRVAVRSRGVQELLCFLLLAAGKEAPRETIASELWGDRSTAQSLKHLSQTLWLMRTLFEEGGFTELHVADGEFLRLALSAGVRLDIQQLDRAYRLASRTQDPTPDELTGLQEAVALYRGELLAGWTQEWCLIERERCRDQALVILDRLVEVSLHRREVQTGLHHARQVLCLEPARESTHRQAMELHLLAGDRTAALRQFDRCAGVLRDEFGVEPAAETRAIWQRARDGEGGRSEPARTPDLADTLRVLNQATRLLLEVKSKLEKLI